MSARVTTLAFRPRQQRQARRRAEREEALRTPHPARIARLLALAHDLDARIEAGEFESYSHVAEVHGVTPARVSQIMSLLALAPAIQEEILALEALPGREPLFEKDLQPVLASVLWHEQLAAWRALRLR